MAYKEEVIHKQHLPLTLEGFWIIGTEVRATRDRYQAVNSYYHNKETLGKKKRTKNAEGRRRDPIDFHFNVHEQIKTAKKKERETGRRMSTVG